MNVVNAEPLFNASAAGRTKARSGTSGTFAGACARRCVGGKWHLCCCVC